MRIQVEHHADLGAAPRSLYRGERRNDIIEIMDQWYGPGYRYVKVRGRDSSVYILLFDEIRDQWELIMFSAASAQQLVSTSIMEFHQMNRSPVASHLRVEVKHRCAAPKRYTWEILSEGKTLPVEESADQFRSWEEASQAGKKALEEIISKSCRTATRGKKSAFN